MSVKKMKSEIIQPEKKEITQPQKMGLLVENPVYKPFRYPWISKWFVNRVFN